MDPPADRALTGATRRLRALSHRRLLVCAALGVSMAGFLVATFSWSPPATFQPRAYEVGSSGAILFVNAPVSPVTDGRAVNDIPKLAARARLLAELAMAPVVMRSVRRYAHAPAALLVADPPGTARGPAVAPVAAEDRRARVVSADVPKLDGGESPIIVITTRAPTPVAAARLARGVIAALRAHVARVGDAQGIPRERRVRLDLLAAPRGSVLRKGPPAGLPAGAAVVAFVLACGLITALPGLAARRRHELDPIVA